MPFQTCSCSRSKCSEKFWTVSEVYNNPCRRFFRDMLKKRSLVHFSTILFCPYPLLSQDFISEKPFLQTVVYTMQDPIFWAKKYGIRNQPFLLWRSTFGSCSSVSRKFLVNPFTHCRMEGIEKVRHRLLHKGDPRKVEENVTAILSDNLSHFNKPVFSKVWS